MPDFVMILQTNYSKHLTTFFQSYEEIIFAYLFGSQTTNRAGPLSDIDVAVYLDEKFSASKRFSLRLNYIRDLSNVLKTDHIDLSILNDSPLNLCFSVVSKGILLCDRKPKKRVAFEVKTMSLFFDRQYYEKRRAEFNLQRVAREGIL